MKRIGLILAAIGILATCMSAQMPGDRGQTSLELSGGKVSIEYGRPALAGRDVKSMLQPGMEWRMGSNASTTLDTNIDLKFANNWKTQAITILNCEIFQIRSYLALLSLYLKLTYHHLKR